MVVVVVVVTVLFVFGPRVAVHRRSYVSHLVSASRRVCSDISSSLAHDLDLDLCITLSRYRLISFMQRD